MESVSQSRVATDLHFNEGACFLPRNEINPKSGCLCKASGTDLKRLLDESGLDTGSGPEDCALVNVNGAPMLLTSDFGPVIGVDLKRGGYIAAVHALSDVWACGGKPRYAQILLAGSEDHGSAMHERMVAVQAGLVGACKTFGVDIVGGQTIIGRDLMAGLSVVGELSLGENMLRKKGGRIGDTILLSKPLGVGLIARGFALQLIGEEELEQALQTAEASNSQASEMAVRAGARAATDVTGFGLMGHLSEMLEPGQGAIIDLKHIRVLPAARDLAGKLCDSEFIYNNLNYVRNRFSVPYVELPVLAPLLDPQTSGGLLVAADTLAANALTLSGLFFPIGCITERAEIELRTS